MCNYSTIMTTTRINATRRGSSFLAEHSATTDPGNPPAANASPGGLGSYSRALEFTSMALASETNMRLNRRHSSDVVVRPDIEEDQCNKEDPAGHYCADHSFSTKISSNDVAIFIPKRRSPTVENRVAREGGRNTSSKPDQHAKNGDVSPGTNADESSSTRQGVYSGGVRYFTADGVRTRKDEVRKAKKNKQKEREREERQEEKTSPPLSASCTDVTIIKKRSKSLSRSNPDIRGHSVTRTPRQFDIPQLPFNAKLPFNDKPLEDNITSLTLKQGRHASFHDRFHDSESFLKKGHNSSFRDSVGASLSRLRRAESNESPPSPTLINSERRIRTKEKNKMAGADDKTTVTRKIRGSGSSSDIMERDRERSHSATRHLVPPKTLPSRSMFENKTTSWSGGGDVCDKKGDSSGRNQSYQLEYGATPSRIHQSSSTDRGRNRISNVPRRDLSPNQVDFMRRSTKDLESLGVDKKKELMRRNSALFTHAKDVNSVDKKKVEDRRNSILSSNSEHDDSSPILLSSVQSQSRDRNSRSQSRDRNSTVKYKAPAALPTRSLFQHKPLFGGFGGCVKGKEDWRNSRPPPSELKLLSRLKSSTDMSTSTRSSIVFPQRVRSRSRSINRITSQGSCDTKTIVCDSRRSSM